MANLNVDLLSQSSGGDKEFEEQLLDAFVESCEPHMKALPGLIKANDKKGVLFRVHTIKVSKRTQKLLTENGKSRIWFSPFLSSLLTNAGLVASTRRHTFRVCSGENGS